jgi:GT2 family glycosyltransferase
MPLISAVIVSWKSAALARAAIESLREDANASGLSLETIAVVNSGDPLEVEELAAYADRVVDPGRNLGYAGGLNAGVRAGRGAVCVLANPDLVVRAGALAALVTEARGGLAAAGPAFFLDEEGTIHLPPSEEPHPLSVMRGRLSGMPSAFRRQLRRGLRAAGEAARGETRSVSALSGALVAVSRETLERVGDFDEGYALYYEENDWQRRLRNSGGRLVRVGAAHVVHRYNQSARLEPRAAAWFEASERRYFGTHFGARGLRALEGRPARPSADAAPAPLAGGVLRLAAPAIVALSPLADFASFAVVPRSAAGAWRPPDDVLSGFGGATWYARAVDPATLEVLSEGAFGRES